MDNDQDAPAEGVENYVGSGENCVGEAAGNSTTAHAYRENIVDRTGELLSSAIAVAEGHVKAGAMLISDPITGVQVPFVQARGNLTPISADAFENYRDAPIRVRGTARHTRLDSFIEHVNRFKNVDTALFAVDQGTTPSVTAVFDYHGETAGGAEADPAFAQHRADYAFPLSEEWKAWHKVDGVKMDMGEFAQFIEDHIVDVEAIADYGAINDTVKQFVQTLGGWATVGSPSKLIELSKGLQIYENAVVKDRRNLSSGEGQISFESEHTDGDGKPINIPKLFIINIPVFARSAVLDRIVVRLRYRATGAVNFWFELWRTDRVFDFAFDEALEKVRTETELPVFVGTDEGPQSASAVIIPEPVF